MKLSICMIVKNEEQKLFNLLTYLRGFVDEICIVDTGSEDLTRSICYEFADKVKCIDEFKNFSHARNLSLSLATGDWILILDADEFIFRSDYLRLKERIIQLEPLAARTLRYNYVGDGRWSISNIIRVIKKSPSIYFSRDVHESVRASLNGYNPKVIGAEIHHLPNNIGKNKTYTSLLSTYLSEHADDIHAKEHFAGELAAVGKFDEALQIYCDILRQKNDLIRACINLVFVALKCNREDTALKYLNDVTRSVFMDIDDFDKAELLNCYTMLHTNKFDYKEAYKYACEAMHYSNLSHLQLNKAYLQYLLGDHSNFKDTLFSMIRSNPFLLNPNIYINRTGMNNSIYNIDVRNIISPKSLVELCKV